MSRCIATALALGAIAIAGCGGPITDDELERGIESLGATAAEGRLVALDVAEDRTKVTFVRVEARDLADDALHEAQKLHDAEAEPGNARVKAQAVRLAQDIDDALGDLQVFPDDRGKATEISDKLDALTSRADELTGEL